MLVKIHFLEIHKDKTPKELLSKGDKVFYLNKNKPYYKSDNSLDFKECTVLTTFEYGVTALVVESKKNYKTFIGITNLFLEKTI